MTNLMLSKKIYLLSIFHQMQTLKFYNWQVAIAPELGGNLCRLCYNDSLEILRTPKRAWCLDKKREFYGLPVLFPPNRISDGQFTIDGTQYTLPINEKKRHNHLHGLPLHDAWVASVSKNRIDMTWTYGAEHPAFTGFPCPCRIELTYEFDPTCVKQTVKIINTGDVELPCGFGFHSVFNTPKRAKITAASWRWEMLPPRWLPSGTKLPWEAFNPTKWFCPADYKISSFHTPIEEGTFDGKPFRGAILDYGKNVVLYEIDENYRYWCLWNQRPDSGFFCPEPMSWMIDAPNLPFPREVSGVRVLAPGEIATYTTKISVH